MGMAALFIIPWLLIGGIPLALLVLVLVRGLTLPRGLRRSTPAVCGRCRHGIAPVSPDTPMLERCPECGLPYTVAGVLTLGLAKKTRPGMVVLILCWTVLAGSLTMFAWAIAGAFLASSTMSSGMQQSFTQSVGAVRSDGGAPTGEPGFSVRFDADLTYQWTGPATAGAITLTVRPDSGPATRVEIDAANGAWTLPSAGAAGGAFDRASAETAFAAAGIDETTPWAQHEARLLADAVAYLRSDPATAMYDVLSNPSVGPSTSVSTGPFGATVTTQTTIGPGGVGTSVTRSIDWYPSHLVATTQSGDSSAGLTFGFESDTIDQRYTGNPSVHAYDGTLAAAFTDDGSGPALREVTITVRPPEGWPAVMAYDPAARTASISRGSESSEATTTTHDEAIVALAGIAGLTTDDGSPDPGLPDLAALIRELEQNPTTYDRGAASAAPGAPGANGVSALAGTPPGDGQPDGGFVTTAPASQNFNPSGMVGTAFPIAIAVTMGVSLLVWVGGIALIVIRRFRLYPERALLGLDAG